MRKGLRSLLLSVLCFSQDSSDAAASFAAATQQVHWLCQHLIPPELWKNFVPRPGGVRGWWRAILNRELSTIGHDASRDMSHYTSLPPSLSELSTSTLLLGCAKVFVRCFFLSCAFHRTVLMLQPVLLQQHSRCIGFASTSFPHFRCWHDNALRSSPGVFPPSLSPLSFVHGLRGAIALGLFRRLC